MKKILILIAAALMLVSFILSGCSADSGSDSADSDVAEPATNTTGDTGASTASTASNAGTDLDAIEVSYSDKDQSADYDESEAVKITLLDNGSVIEGEGVSASGNSVTITSAGTYVVSGELKNGQLVVDTTKVDTVQIVLDGVHITNETGSAIFVKQSEKTIITLANGSDNYIVDGADYALTGEKDPDAAIYAGDDLTINGSGSLTVNGNYKHGIKTVDDLVVTSGKLNITAIEEGLRGKDSVSILNGDITIDTGGEAIKSDNSEEEGSGWISIDGGTFSLRTGNNGIQAQTGLIINAGTLSISAAQDTLHCNGSIRVTGGDITLEAGDDGVHADNALDVTGGTIIVQQSYEGLEGAEITISGGAIAINANDDGLNAAGGSDGDMKPGDRFAERGDYFIAISGGYTYVNSGGDGVDSNGDIEISGGTVIVDGPESDNNSAMDTDQGSFVVSGGTLIAAGSSGMLVSPTEAMQPVLTILFDTTEVAGTSVTMADESGKALFTVSPSKSFKSLMISSPDLEEKQTYSILYGGEVLGESKDGTYYEGASVSNEMSAVSVTIGDLISFISPDGTQTSYSGGMGGHGGGMDRPEGKPGRR